MDIINSFKTEDIPHAYVSLDDAEGATCVGHWIMETSFFLPDIKELQKTLPYKLKILLNQPKKYKTNILSDFGFHDEDIVYSSKMISDKRGTGAWQENHVIPEESEYMMYLPKFLYVGNTSIHTLLFFECITKFRNYYISKLPTITKTIPITYVARSLKEFYKPNHRGFTNKKEIRNMLERKGVNILDTDSLTSLLPQFEVILKSKTLIVEMGSAFTINAALISSGSQIIVINETFNYHNSEWHHMVLLRKLIAERDNTVEIFSKGQNWTPFTVDEVKLEKRVSDLLENNL
jgi:hypothetical protein